MKIIDSWFDEPSNYKHSGLFMQGGSPNFIKHLFDYFSQHKRDITSVFASLYLFNNPYLYRIFKSIVDAGAEVVIVSLPIEGYDDRHPTRLLDAYTGEYHHSAKTKKALAKSVYSQFATPGSENLSLYQFPHVYVRSERMRKFSRGNLPYSMHNKSIFIDYKNGDKHAIITSSNLAVRDECKHEAMILCDVVDVDERKSIEAFCKELKSNSTVYDPNKAATLISSPNRILEYTASQNNCILSPFFKNSPFQADKILYDLLISSKNRLYICAQHIAGPDEQYLDKFADPNGKGEKIEYSIFLKGLFEKSYEGIDLKILSQTFVDKDGSTPHGHRRPRNTYKFQQFSRKLSSAGIESYGCNPKIHMKFIVSDDKVAFTNFNFTPTEFLFLPHVNIPELKLPNGKPYSGVYSEVGHLAIIDDKHAADQFADVFNNAYTSSSTYRVSDNQN